MCCCCCVCQPPHPSSQCRVCVILIGDSEASGSELLRCIKRIFGRRPGGVGTDVKTHTHTHTHAGLIEMFSIKCGSVPAAAAEGDGENISEATKMK